MSSTRLIAERARQEGIADDPDIRHRLRLLEERLLDFEGTRLLVSHDRAFLDNVVTSVIVFEEDGKVQGLSNLYWAWLNKVAGN